MQKGEIGPAPFCFRRAVSEEGIERECARITSQAAAVASTAITISPFWGIESGGGNQRRRAVLPAAAAAPHPPPRRWRSASRSAAARLEHRRGKCGGGGGRGRWRTRTHSLPLHLCFTRMDGMRRGEKEEILLFLCDGGGGWDVKRLLRWCFALPYLVAAFVKSRCFTMMMATLKLIL